VALRHYHAGMIDDCGRSSRLAPLWRRVALLFVVLTLQVLASPGIARAQTPEEAFTEGLTKFDEGDCEAALPLFQTAFEGTKSPNARLYVARCLAQLGRDVEAYREMSGTLALARDKAETEPKYAKTRDAAAAELAQLEPKVGKIIVAFDTPYEGAVILLDGEEVPEAQQGVPIPVRPGDLQITARAPGKEEHTETVAIDGGQTKAVAIVLEDAAPITDEEEDTGPGLGTLRIVGIAVAGLGVASMATFAATGSMASSKFSSVEDACGGQTCPDDSHNADIDAGKTLQTVANATLGIGIALMAGGAALIIFGGPGEDDGEDGDGDAEARIELVPIVAPTPGGGVLGLTGRF